MSIFLALGTLAAAQDAQEETPPADPAVGATNEAMVRFLHAAPNAEISNVVLTTGDGETAEVEAFAGVGYGELTDYVAVPAVGYDVAVNLAVVEGEEAGGVEVPADALDTFAGEYYTIVLMGVVRPAEDAEETGFLDWLQGLFTDADDQFALRALVISDLTQFAVDENEAEVRIVHVAPGTEAVDLVVVDAEGANVVHSVGYGDVSGFDRLVPTGTMELRVAGSEAPILDLSDQQVDSGASSTIFLIGTPVEAVPLEVVVAQNPVITTATAPGAPGAVPGAPAAVPPAVSTEQTWMRDSLNEIEARLANIEERLRALAEGNGTEEDVTAALDQVAEAMALIDDARDQMAAQPGPAPVVVPPAETTDPAEPDGDGN